MRINSDLCSSKQIMKVLIVGSFIQIVHRLEEMVSEIQGIGSIYSAVKYDEVLPILKEKEINVILLGISLPENKSIELLSEIRAMYPAIPVVALSISMNDYVYEQCRLFKVNYLLDTYRDFEKLTGIIHEMTVNAGKNNSTNPDPVRLN